MSWQEIRLLCISVSQKSVKEVLTKEKKIICMDGRLLFAFKGAVLIIYPDILCANTGRVKLKQWEAGCKSCPLPCLPLTWKVNCYKRVTCKLLVRAISLADKRALSWMGRREGEVPWSLLSQYNVLDLIEAGKTEQNTAGALKRVMVCF